MIVLGMRACDGDVQEKAYSRATGWAKGEVNGFRRRRSFKPSNLLIAFLVSPGDLKLILSTSSPASSSWQCRSEAHFPDVLKLHSHCGVGRLRGCLRLCTASSLQD